MKHTNVQKFLITACLLLLGTFMVDAQDLPPNPEYGKCYAKCRIPDEYKTVTEQLLVKDESKRIITIPAQYDTQTEQLLVKEASTKIVPVPAVYQTVTETIEVKPASSKLVEVPAVYETMTERIQTAPESGKWVTKNVFGSGTSGGSGYSSGGSYSGSVSSACLSGKGDPADCNIVCWEKVPAQYKTITKKVLKSPATTNEIEIPAEFQTVTRQVVQTPATTQTVDIPAEYRTITKRVLVSPAQTKEEIIPAEYKTVTKTELIKGGGDNGWEEVVCDVKINQTLIKEVQQALKNAGYYNGAIDGIQGGGTNSALRKYQQEKGLPVGNMNIKTLKALGVY